ncbi:MAG: hypothetical protein QGI24_10945, partial [Kiritimatiellia bacterium]|nr:hypothetical protein [Kiritimatiellia bacterium]
MDFPRTLLLTAWRQDARYAGAEAIRRILGQLPRDRIRWSSLEQMKTEGELDLPACATFELRRPHWRLAKSTFGYLWTHELQTKRLADRIADWASDFDPELIWVLPELAAIPTATHLAGITGIPLHATLYDVLESAREICIPALYYSRYMRNVKCLFGMLSSLDTVSPELLGHVRATYGFADDRPAMAMPPSVPESWIHSRSSARREISGKSRRIGFCGAFRTTPAQWISFLDTLSELPYDFEIVAFASSDSVHGVGLPGNVTLALQPYEPSEHDVIRRFIRMDVDACYLGLWKDP